MFLKPVISTAAVIGVALALVSGGAGGAQRFEPVKPFSIYDALVQITAQTIEDRERRAARAETAAARKAAAHVGMTFHVLLGAITAAGLVDLLDGDTVSDTRPLAEGEADFPVPYTLFAPTDRAFAALPKGKFARILEADNKDELAAMVRAHVVPGLRLQAGAAAGVSNLITLNGEVVRVSTLQKHMRLTVNGAMSTVIAADITTGIADKEGKVRDNGVVHIVDRVLAYTYPSPSKDL